MAIPRKTSQAPAISLSGQWPQPPRIPQKFIDRFEELEPLPTQVDQWWQQISLMLERDRQEILTKFASLESSTSASIQVLQEQVKALQQQVEAITGTDLGGLAAQVAGLSSQVADLAGELAAHILANVAHGTATNIVGVMDEQPLDKKTIGGIVPRYGRFTAGAVGVKRILSTETITVGANDFLVVGGELQVSGQLVIEGTLVMV